MKSEGERGKSKIKVYLEDTVQAIMKKATIADILFFKGTT